MLLALDPVPHTANSPVTDIPPALGRAADIPPALGGVVDMPLVFDRVADMPLVFDRVVEMLLALDRVTHIPDIAAGERRVCLGRPADMRCPRSGAETRVGRPARGR
jgi:hypothetical protein